MAKHEFGIMQTAPQKGKRYDGTKRSKRLYKIELLMLKLIPMILAFTALLNSILS